MNSFKNEKISRELIDNFNNVIINDYGIELNENEIMESLSNIFGLIQVLIEIDASSSNESSNYKSESELDTDTLQYQEKTT